MVYFRQSVNAGVKHSLGVYILKKYVLWDFTTSFSRYLSPRFFKKSKGDIIIASVRPFVCPLCYLLLNYWTEFNQIWCVSYNYKWGVQQHFFCPAPWGPGEGSKGQI